MKKTHVHNHIRKLRFLDNEMTQQQLADLVGVSRQTMVAIEKEKYSPSIEIAFLIAKVFDMSLEEVFYYENEDKEEH